MCKGLEVGKHENEKHGCMWGKARSLTGLEHSIHGMLCKVDRGSQCQVEAGKIDTVKTLETIIGFDFYTPNLYP